MSKLYDETYLALGYFAVMAWTYASTTLCILGDIIVVMSEDDRKTTVK